MTKRNLDYLAGIIDGEGCFNINYHLKRNTYRLRLSVMNTNIDLMNWLITNFGGQYYHRKKYQEHWKERYEWCLFAYKPQIELIQQLSQRLLIKKKQAEVASNFLNTYLRTGHKLTIEDINIRNQSHQRMKELNS